MSTAAVAYWSRCQNLMGYHSVACGFGAIVINTPADGLITGIGRVSGVDCMIAAARRPMDRFYQWLYFEDVFEGGDFIPMAHAGMIPHRVLNCDIAVAKRRWVEVDHPWYPLFFETYHPDIELEPLAVTQANANATSDGRAALAATGHSTSRNRLAAGRG